MTQPASPSKIPRTLTGFLKFLFQEIIRQRKWFLLPLLLILGLLALAILLSGGTGLLPAIYLTF